MNSRLDIPQQLRVCGRVIGRSPSYEAKSWFKWVKRCNRDFFMGANGMDNPSSFTLVYGSYRFCHSEWSQTVTFDAAGQRSCRRGPSLRNAAVYHERDHH